MSDGGLGNEQELIKAAMAGDELAFRQLVDTHQQAVAAVVIGMLGNTDAAQDVGQEVFIRFYGSMGKFRGQSSLRTYLTRIAINLSLNELKKIKTNRLLVAGDAGAFETLDDEAQNPARSDLKEWVQRAILQLEPEFRSVVVLRLIEGYDTKEVAEMLGLPIGTVLSRLSRGQKKLKTLLVPKTESYG